MPAVPLKLKKTPARERPPCSSTKWTIKQDGLHLGEKAVVAIEVSPARLRHADRGVGEVVNDLHDPLGRRDKVGIEDGDEVARCLLETGVERARLIAVAVRAVNVDDVVAEGAIALRQSAGYLLGLVGRIIENLYLELLRGIFQAAAGVDEAIDHVLLVEDRQLHGDAREFP